MAQKVFGSVSFFGLIKGLVRRFYVVFLVFLAVVFIVLGKADHTVIDTVQVGTEAVVMPMVDLVSVPVKGVRGLSTMMTEIFTVHTENKKLLAEQKVLREWEAVARALMVENKALRDLMHYVPPPDHRFVTARVVAEQGGTFVQELVALAGRKDGVQKGHIVMTGEGLLGRIIKTGSGLSHILLVTDINSRLPVMIEGTTMRAILAGDNSDQPLLVALPLHQQPKVGDRVVTSHQSGLFPQGLPVGVVSYVSNRTIRVQLFASPSKVPVVRIVDFGLESVLPETEEDL